MSHNETLLSLEEKYRIAQEVFEDYATNPVNVNFESFLIEKLKEYKCTK